MSHGHNPSIIQKLINHSMLHSIIQKLFLPEKDINKNYITLLHSIKPVQFGNQIIDLQPDHITHMH